MNPKPPRPVSRLKQCNKVLRLQRRRLGQWKPQGSVAPVAPDLNSLGALL